MARDPIDEQLEVLAEKRRRQKSDLARGAPSFKVFSPSGHATQFVFSDGAWELFVAHPRLGWYCLSWAHVFYKGEKTCECGGMVRSDLRPRAR